MCTRTYYKVWTVDCVLQELWFLLLLFPSTKETNKYRHNIRTYCQFRKIALSSIKEIAKRPQNHSSKVSYPRGYESEIFRAFWSSFVNGFCLMMWDISTEVCSRIQPSANCYSTNSKTRCLVIHARIVFMWVEQKAALQNFKRECTVISFYLFTDIVNALVEMCSKHHLFKSSHCMVLFIIKNSQPLEGTCSNPSKAYSSPNNLQSYQMRTLISLFWGRRVFD